MEFSRLIRGPENTLHCESMRMTADGSFFILSNKERQTTHTFQPNENNMPAWWRRPSPEACSLHAGTENFAEPKHAITVVPFLTNGCTVYRLNGWGHYAQTPRREPIQDAGKITMLTDVLHPEEHNIEQALQRLIADVTGFLLPTEKSVYIGRMYDPDAGHCNDVFRINALDSLLLTPATNALVHAHTVHNPAMPFHKQLVSTLSQLSYKLTQDQGLGKVYLWHEDVDEAIAAGALTRLTRRILETFPELHPKPAPRKP